MVKYFCDACGVEIAPKETNRVKAIAGKLGVEVIHYWDGVSNGGQICHRCIVTTVKSALSDEQSQP